MKMDRAVRRLKALPKNRNCSAPKTVYACGICHAFQAETIGEAWAHSMGHGPWPLDDEGSIVNTDSLPVLGSLLYNRVEPPLMTSGTLIRRLT